MSGPRRAYGSVDPEKWAALDEEYGNISEDSRLLHNPLENPQAMRYDEPASNNSNAESFRRLGEVDSIKHSLLTIRPYLQSRLQEKNKVVQILEIFHTGESKYKISLTLEGLLNKVLASAAEIDNNATPPRHVRGDDDFEDDNNSEDASSPNNDATPRRSQYYASNIASNNNISTSRNIQLYDLRHLEFQFNPHEEPTILVRRHAVLISLNPLRAIVMADRIILVVPDGADTILYLLHEHMLSILDESDPLSNVIPSFQSHNKHNEKHRQKSKRKQKTNEENSQNEDNECEKSEDSKEMFYEYVFYHAIFATAVALHTQEYIHITSRFQRVLEAMKANKTVTIEVQEEIRWLKNQVTSEFVKINANQRVLADFANNEELMALMNLTLLKKDPNEYNRSSFSSDLLNAVNDITILVESYLMNYNSLGSKLEYLKAQIQNTEEMVHFRLDSARNELLIIDATVNVVMACVGCTTFFASAFGMNLASGIENENIWVFWFTFGFLLLLTIVSAVLVMFYFGIFGMLPSRQSKMQI